MLAKLCGPQKMAIVADGYTSSAKVCEHQRKKIKSLYVKVNIAEAMTVHPNQGAFLAAPYKSQLLLIISFFKI